MKSVISDFSFMDINNNEKHIYQPYCKHCHCFLKIDSIFYNSGFTEIQMNQKVWKSSGLEGFSATDHEQHLNEDISLLCGRNKWTTCAHLTCIPRELSSCRVTGCIPACRLLRKTKKMSSASTGDEWRQWNRSNVSDKTWEFMAAWRELGGEEGMALQPACTTPPHVQNNPATPLSTLHPLMSDRRFIERLPHLSPTTPTLMTPTELLQPFHNF